MVGMGGVRVRLRGWFKRGQENYGEKKGRTVGDIAPSRPDVLSEGGASDGSRYTSFIPPWAFWSSLTQERRIDEGRADIKTGDPSVILERGCDGVFTTTLRHL